MRIFAKSKKIIIELSSLEADRLFLIIDSSTDDQLYLYPRNIFTEEDKKNRLKRVTKPVMKLRNKIMNLLLDVIYEVEKIK